MIPLEQVAPYLWRIPPDARPGMRVPALVVADEALISNIRREASLEQLANGATLPGIVKAALAMPDIHQGYGLPVGGVVATDAERGVVSPGAIGFDINCGVRLLATGVGSESRVTLAPRDLGRVMERGAAWAVERGWGDPADVGRLESEGRIAGADPGAVSAQAIERGRRQLGTLGSGNHFLEVQVVDEVFDERQASRLGVRAGQVTVMIHTGSRGLGHQVCTDYLKTTERALRRYGIVVADRQLLTHWAREVFERVFTRSPRDLAMRVVYDVAHNIAKEEEHEVDGRRRRLLVHRKGATRAFPGQPVLVPGDMGRYSYVLVGTEAAMQETFGSTCHGAGRLLSRTAAVKAARGRRIDRELAAQGVMARSTGRDALAEEMPEAYKDVKDVVDVVHRFGISTRVARLRPIGVIKG